MKIGEIRGEMDNLDVVGKIVEIGEVREVETRYGRAAVAVAKLQDETGSVRLNLWRDQIGMVKVGDVVKLQGAFVKVFRDKCELNLGKKGKITVLSELKLNNENACI